MTYLLFSSFVENNLKVVHLASVKILTLYAAQVSFPDPILHLHTRSSIKVHQVAAPPTLGCTFAHAQHCKLLGGNGEGVLSLKCSWFNIDYEVTSRSYPVAPDYALFGPEWAGPGSILCYSPCVETDSVNIINHCVTFVCIHCIHCFPL